jgi:hypothetical protein
MANNHVASHALVVYILKKSMPRKVQQGVKTGLFNLRSFFRNAQ